MEFFAVLSFVLVFIFVGVPMYDHCFRWWWMAIKRGGAPPMPERDEYK
jgi:hypothetical protein